MKKFFLNTSPVEEALISLLKKDNNVVVTTKCNLGCVFCSRKFNPFTTKCFHYDFNFIKSQIALLNPNWFITVNASISRLTDGEPFTHPRIWDILKFIRKKFPYKQLNQLHDKLQITTNGSFLTKENLRKLDALGGIILVHSINTTDKDKWINLTCSNENLAKTVTNVPDLVKNYNITYLPSIVALPRLVGWNDIEKTVRDLDQSGAKVLRMFLPTYTKYASKKEQAMLKCDKKKLLKLVLKLRKELKMKILCYPFYSNEPIPQITGFEAYDILPTDTILTIDNEKVFSSWHAQQLLLSPKREVSVVNFERSGVPKTTFIRSRDIPVLSYVNLRVNEDVVFLPRGIVGAVGDCSKVLVLMSEAGGLVVRKAFEKAVEWEPVLAGKKFFFRSVKSKFYEGNVVCAGLLMCSDYREAIKEFLSSESTKPDLILMSRRSFDPLGRDLLKDSVYDLSDEFNIPVKTL